MSSFYGDTTRLPMSPFFFDKIFEEGTTLDDMNSSAQTDGVFLNRYVLLKAGDAGQVYQKQYNADKEFQYVFIASLTAPFVVSDEGVSYDFNLPEDYETVNRYSELGEGETANAKWVTGDAQKYTLDIQLKEIGNALAMVYNALGGINTEVGSERAFKVIRTYAGTPIDSNISLEDYIYHLAYDESYHRYGLIVPIYQVSDPFSDEQMFKNYSNQGTPIFLYDPEAEEDEYTGTVCLSFDSSQTYYVYEKIGGEFLKNIDKFEDSLYGLIGYFNGLRYEGYTCDRNSLQGCIDYANRVIDRLNFANLEKITFDLGIEQTPPNLIKEEFTLSYSAQNDDGETVNTETSVPMYLLPGDGISMTATTYNSSPCVKIELDRLDEDLKAKYGDTFNTNFSNQYIMGSLYGSCESLTGYVVYSGTSSLAYKLKGECSFTPSVETNSVTLNLGQLIKMLIKGFYQPGATDLEIEFSDNNFFMATSVCQSSATPIQIIERTGSASNKTLYVYNVLDPSAAVSSTIQFKFYAEGEVTIV